MTPISSIPELIALALSLGASAVTGWSAAEEELRQSALPFKISPERSAWAYQEIQKGSDPLGDLFCNLLSSKNRRPLGAVYTPPRIVDHMLQWAFQQKPFHRVVDPGTGSVRFLTTAGRLEPHVALYGIEIDPVAAILARGNIAASGLAIYYTWRLSPDNPT